MNTVTLNNNSAKDKIHVRIKDAQIQARTLILSTCTIEQIAKNNYLLAAIRDD